MGRSVCYLNNSEFVIYIDASYIQETEDYIEWDFFKEDITETLMAEFPSLEPCDKWENREVNIFLSNNIAEIGISEYIGCVSLSFRGFDDLGSNWCRLVKKKVYSLLSSYTLLRKIGVFSNGNSVFETM